MWLRHLPVLATMVMSVGGTLAITQTHLVSPQAVAETIANRPQPNSPQVNGWLKELNLSPQQVERIKRISNQARVKMTPKIKALRQAQQELMTMMAGSASQTQLRKKFNQIKSLRQQLADAEFENNLAIREILTPNQRRKLVEFMYKARRQAISSQPN
jgi:protein CpxP